LERRSSMGKGASWGVLFVSCTWNNLYHCMIQKMTWQLWVLQCFLEPSLDSKIIDAIKKMGMWWWRTQWRSKKNCNVCAPWCKGYLLPNYMKKNDVWNEEINPDFISDVLENLNSKIWDRGYFKETEEGVWYEMYVNKDVKKINLKLILMRSLQNCFQI